MTQLPAKQSPLEQLLYNVIRITAYDGDGNLWHGTGFFVDTKPVAMDRTIPTLVTNRHVLEGALEIDLAFHLGYEDGSAPTGEHIVIRCPVQSDRLILHPRSDVDLMAYLVGPAFHTLAARGMMPFRRPVGFDDILQDSDYAAYDVLEGVVMVGCPNGIYDVANNFPIMRRGVTASHPGVPYEGRPEFLVDLACFGGSSGSPIFTWNSVGSFDREKGEYSQGFDRFRLIGVLYAGPVIDCEGVVTFASEPRVSVQTPMHLGLAIRASEIRALLEPVKCGLEGGKCAFDNDAV